MGFNPKMLNGKRDRIVSILNVAFVIGQMFKVILLDDSITRQFLLTNVSDIITKAY